MMRISNGIERKKCTHIFHDFMFVLMGLCFDTCLFFFIVVRIKVKIAPFFSVGEKKKD